MTRTLALLLACVTLPAAVVAQADVAAYCAQLGNLPLRHTGTAGGEGRLTPDLTTLGAINDCNKGNYVRRVPSEGVDTAASFDAALARSLATKDGPTLIEIMVKS